MRLNLGNAPIDESNPERDLSRFQSFKTDMDIVNFLNNPYKSPLYTKLSSNRVLAVRVNDSAADVAAKLYNLLKRIQEQQQKQSKTESKLKEPKYTKKSSMIGTFKKVIKSTIGFFHKLMKKMKVTGSNLYNTYLAAGLLTAIDLSLPDSPEQSHIASLIKKIDDFKEGDLPKEISGLAGDLENKLDEVLHDTESKIENSDVWKDTSKLIKDSGIVDSVKNTIKETVDFLHKQLTQLVGKDVADTLYNQIPDIDKVFEDDTRQMTESVFPLTSETYEGATLLGKGKGEGYSPSVLDKTLGRVSKKYESGGAGAGTISSGKDDMGGASYGTYQLSSKTGTLQSFLVSSGYSKQFEGLKPTTQEFNERWRQIARDDPKFGEAQHQFMVTTHYSPLMSNLKQNGIDLYTRGSAIQEMVFSTATQYGETLASKIIRSAVGGDISNMSDSDIISAVQDYKYKNVESLFKSSPGWWELLKDRAINEKKTLLEIAKSEENQKSLQPKSEISGDSFRDSRLEPITKPNVVGDAIDSTTKQNKDMKKEMLGVQPQITIINNSDLTHINTSINDTTQNVQVREPEMFKTYGLGDH